MIANLQGSWDDVRYFLAVAEAGSLQGAAHDLGVNHSTVFRRITGFEKSTGTRLFERLPDGYHLTLAGEELLAHARRAGEEIDLLSLKVLGKDYRPSGKIRLTAPDNIAYEFLPPYLVSFLEDYPDIDLEIVVGAESLDLTRREADVAIRATSEPPPHLIGRRVADLGWSFFAGRAYAQRPDTPTRYEELTRHRLIGADGPLRRLPPFRRLDAELSPHIRMRCSTLNAMSSIAAANFGVALMPDDQQRPTLSRLFGAEPIFKSTLWILTHPELRRTERIKLLIDHLFESLRGDSRLRW